MRSSPTARPAPVPPARADSFMRPPAPVLFLALMGGLCASPAQAHSDVASLGVFWSGAVHLLLSFERLALIIVFGIWAGMQRRRANAAFVGAIGLGAFAAALATRPDVAESHSASAIAIAGLLLIGAAGVARIQMGLRTLLIAAACCGMIAGAIGATGDAIRDRALNATALALVAAAVAAYSLMASSFVLQWRHARLGLTLCAGVVTLLAAACASGYSRICGYG